MGVMKTIDSKFHLKETCDLFQVSPSKVLFWEKKGLLHINRSADNDYRVFSFFDHADLSDIIFYKKMGLSLSEIKQLHSMDLDEFSSTLFEAKKRTEEQIESILLTQQEIDRRIGIINSLYSLERAGFQETNLPIKGIIPLYDINAFQYSELLINLENFSVVLDYDPHQGDPYKFQYQFGLIVSDCSKYEHLLFKPENAPGKYIRFLLKIPYEQGFENYRIDVYLDALQKEYGRTDRIICKYLLTCVDQKDDILYDYFDAYAQLKD